MACILLDHTDYIVTAKRPNQLVYKSYYSRNISSLPLLNELEQNMEQKLYPIHRLDYKTSGLLLFAKSSDAARHFQQAFEKRSPTKTYLALVRGFFDQKSGVINTPVKHPETGKYQEAETYYETVLELELPYPVQPYSTCRYSFVIFQPKTGRMHQLRKHANKVAHPIIGDHRYGNRHHNQFYAQQWAFANLCLHAWTLEIEDLSGKALKLEVPLPSAWNVLFESLFREASITFQSIAYEDIAKGNDLPFR